MKDPETVKTLTIRREAAGRLAALRKDLGALAERRRDFEALTKKRDDITRDLTAQRIELISADASLDAAIRTQEAILIETTPKDVSEAEAFFSAKVTALRRPGSLQWGGRPEDSNLEAVSAALCYCREALRSLAAMRLASEPDLPKIAALKAGIPSIDRCGVVTAEEPEEVRPCA